MPEQLRTQEPIEPFEPPFDPEASPLTYGDVLNDPNTHEALHPHLQRLAAGESSAPWKISGDLNDNVEPEEEPSVHNAEVGALLANINKWLERKDITGGDGTFEALQALSDPEAVQAYKASDCTSAQVAELLHGAVKLQEKYETQRAEAENLIEWQPNYNLVRSFIIELPADTLRELYHNEDFRHVLEAPGNGTALAYSLLTLRKIYDTSYMADLAQPGSMAQQDPLVQKMLQAPEAKSAIAREIMNEMDGGLPEMVSAEKRDYADRYLENVVGLPTTLRDDLLFASHGRTSNEDNGYVDSMVLKEMLVSVADRVDALGLDKVVRLREKAGIVNLDYYNIDQLKLMSKLIEGDEDTIAHLRAGDVTLVLTDAKSDYNGAMRTNSEQFATDANRTLFFEINDIDDFDTYREMLMRLGVRPSTLVLAMHGSPGSTEFANVEDAIKYPEDVATAEVTKKIARIAREAMQDSRGIDDNIEAKGRRRIVMRSCSKAVPVEVWRSPEEKRRFWRRFRKQESEYGIWEANWEQRQESAAEVLMRNIGKPGVDIYAGDAITSTEKTERGIRMSEHIPIPNPKKNAPKYRVVPLDITRISLDRRGRLRERHIKELILRKASSEEQEKRSDIAA